VTGQGHGMTKYANSNSESFGICFAMCPVFVDEFSDFSPNFRRWCISG